MTKTTNNNESNISKRDNKLTYIMIKLLSGKELTRGEKLFLAKEEEKIMANKVNKTTTTETTVEQEAKTTEVVDEVQETVEEVVDEVQETVEEVVDEVQEEVNAPVKEVKETVKKSAKEKLAEIKEKKLLEVKKDMHTKNKPIEEWVALHELELREARKHRKLNTILGIAGVVLGGLALFKGNTKSSESTAAEEFF